MRGSKPGERRGGRKKGTPNKTTAEIRELAQAHGPDAIAEAARLMKSAASEATRIAAIGLILDRGYGKSVQPMEHGGPDGDPITLEALIMASYKKEALESEEGVTLAVDTFRA